MFKAVVQERTLECLIWVSTEALISGVLFERNADGGTHSSNTTSQPSELDAGCTRNVPYTSASTTAVNHLKVEVRLDTGSGRMKDDR